MLLPQAYLLDMVEGQKTGATCLSFETAATCPSFCYTWYSFQPPSKMAALFKLNDELGFPGAAKLYLAAKRRGLKVTKDEAKAVAQRNIGNETIGPSSPALARRWPRARTPGGKWTWRM